MTSVLRAALTRRGGIVRTDGQDSDWRRVPRLDLLPARRTLTIRPLVVGLIVVLLAELVVVQQLYRDLSSIDQQVVDASRRLDEAEGLIAVEESAMADMDGERSRMADQAKGIGERQDQIEQAQAALAESRTDWASALDALLRIDGPDVRFTKVVAQTGGKVDATATLSEARALGIFLDHMRSEENVLQLLDYQKGLSQSEQGEPTQVLSVQVQVR